MNLANRVDESIMPLVRLSAFTKKWSPSIDHRDRTVHAQEADLENHATAYEYATALASCRTSTPHFTSCRSSPLLHEGFGQFVKVVHGGAYDPIPSLAIDNLSTIKT